MFNLGPTELVLILGIALVIFGPAKLPELGKSLGKGIKEFKNESSNLMGDKETNGDTVKKDQ